MGSSHYGGVAVAPQHLPVGADRLPEGHVLVVRDPVPVGDLLHDVADGRIMDAADLGEEVVLDLEIEPPTYQQMSLLFRAKLAVVSISWTAQVCSMFPDSSGRG